MRFVKLSVLLWSGLLACSGRYVSTSHEGAGAEPGVGDGATAATGAMDSSGPSNGGQITMKPPPTAGGTFAVGGATSTGGSITPTAGSMAVAGGAPPEFVDEAACGVPAGQPQAIARPITNYMIWWTRLSRLIWADQPHASPADLPSSISYQQAGQIADEAIDQAIA